MPHDDFDFEPVKGLPEALPPGEHILWQGAPDWRRLATEAFALNWVAGYFAALFLWRWIGNAGLVGWADAAVQASFFAALGLIACGFLALVAWVQARTTVYTITNRRVAMRIGAALTLTLNLPFSALANANLKPGRRGTGTIALEMMGEGQGLGYMMTWPHVRPWHVRQVQPALRCIPDAQRIAALLADAAEAEVFSPRIGRDTAPAAAAFAAE